MSNRAVKVLALVALAMLPYQSCPLSAAHPEISAFDIAGELRASDLAEIYIVSRDHFFPVGLSPYMVRTVGCRYLVYRRSPQWGDFERSMAAVSLDLSPSNLSGEVRVGLVLSDGRGTRREIYANDRAWQDGRVLGLDQRRSVEISEGFVAALLDFTARHSDLAVPDAGPVPHCPHVTQ